MHLARNVVITENGRDGTVRYHDALGSIDGYWEFGGGEVIAIVSMGSVDDWTRAHRWALASRSDILRFIGDEVIRQRAPTCSADIDNQTGVILLRQAGTAGALRDGARALRQAKAVQFVRRYSDLRAKLATVVLAVIAIAGALMWFVKGSLTVAPASGSPLGECVRFDGRELYQSGGLACLIQKTDPHLPNLTGRGGGETTSVSLMLIPLNGREPEMFRITGGLSSTAYSLARIMGSDGETLWVDVAGLWGVRLTNSQLIGPEDLRRANPSLDAFWWDDQRGMGVDAGRLRVMLPDRSAAIEVDPSSLAASAVSPKALPSRSIGRSSPDDLLAAGLVVSPDQWLGLLTAAETATSYKVGAWIKPVESADRRREARRLSAAKLEPSSGRDRFRIRSIASVNDSDYLDAAFLRMDAKSEPLRLAGPDGAFVIHSSSQSASASLMLTRIGVQGDVLWTTDTGLDRFTLKQIFPGSDVVAFVGAKPPIPGKLSEPLVVLVDGASGKATVQSLWR